ncbi:MAG: DUF6429 family protein [Elusimicrobiota bacterium]
MKNIPRDKLEDITLALAYATGWEENGVVRSWKSYPYEIINSLLEKKLISFAFKAKSMFFTPEGLEKAKALAEKYFSEKISQ